jgi:LacI family transcriptional regulator
MSRPRIKDVAARAGVAASTVSGVLNGVAGVRVSTRTRQRILAAAEELGYASNAIARSLRTRRTQTIGFVGDVIATTPYAGRLIQGAQDAAWRAGSLLLLVSTGGDAELEERAIDELIQRQVDGLIYATMFHRVVTVPAALERVSSVLLDARPEDGTASPYVVPDEEGGARAAVVELRKAGHRRIGYATEMLPLPATIGRRKGFEQAMGELFDPHLVVPAGGDSAGGHEAAGRLLDLADPPTAIFCWNDRMALGAYRAAAERGLRIPDDVSIVGFDDQELIAAELVPALTTVALPHHAMGEWAVNRLLGVVGEPSHHMACPLVRRDSVGPPPGDARRC